MYVRVYSTIGIYALYNINKKIDIRMFTAALFMIARNLKLLATNRNTDTQVI